MSKNGARRSVKLLILLLICVISLSSVVKARPMPQQDDEKKTKKLPPRNYIRSRDFDMQHIALNLNFDWDKEQAFGTATITLAPLVPDFKTVNLDAGLMILNAVKLNGKDLKFEYDKSASALAINLDRIYKIGELLTFIIDYRTSGESVSNTLGFGGVNGLKFVKPTAEQPNKRWQIWKYGRFDWSASRRLARIERSKNASVALLNINF